MYCLLASADSRADAYSAFIKMVFHSQIRHGNPRGKLFVSIQIRAVRYFRNTIVGYSASIVRAMTDVSVKRSKHYTHTWSREPSAHCVCSAARFQPLKSDGCVSRSSIDILTHGHRNKSCLQPHVPKGPRAPFMA